MDRFRILNMDDTFTTYLKKLANIVNSLSTLFYNHLNIFLCNKNAFMTRTSHDIDSTVQVKI